MSKQKNRTRYTIDFTPGASEEVQRICDTFGLTIVDLFRYSLLLMRIYTNAIEAGGELRIVNPENPNDLPRIVSIPLFKKIERAKP